MLKQLSHAASMSSGHNIWVLADLPNSRWTQRLNWYLNFHIRQTFPSREKSSALKKTISLCDLNLKETALKTPAPLLIASQDLLPNRWTIIIPYETKTQWFQQLTEVVEKINSKSVRLFLPDTATSKNSVSFLKNLPFDVSIAAPNQ